MELTAYARVLLKGWWIIIISVLLCLVATFAWTLQQTPIYRAQTTLIIRPITPPEDLSSFLLGLDALARQGGIIETFNGVITSKTVIDLSANQMQMTPAEMKFYKISSGIVSEANIINITVEGPDPARVSMLANNLSAQTMIYTQSLYWPYGIKILDSAIPPEKPIFPSTSQNLILAVVAGLGLGFALAFMGEHLRGPANPAVYSIANGVHSKPYFMDRLSQELSRADRQGYDFSAGLLQLRILEAVTDSSVSNTLDDALKQAATLLKQCLRPEDSIARVGQDKLAFQFPDTPGELAREKLQGMQLQVEQQTFELISHGGWAKLESAGGVAAGRPGESADELMARVEEALQRANTRDFDKTDLWREIFQGAR